MPELCLLEVHAHPDDESSKGAGTVARYHAEGVRTVLVTCTGGEEGDILNPAMDRPGVVERLPEIRMEELKAATDIIGYDEVVMLGYRDSGMPDSPANANPASFAAAPLDEAVGRLVAVIRRVRPQVLVTYPQDQSGYPHPDHLRTNEISEVAFDAAGDPTRYPDAGEPWQPLKLYYVTWSVRRMVALHEKHLELGMESPVSEERLARVGEVPPPTTIIDVNGFSRVTREALLAHATQVDPTSKFWFGLPPEVMDGLHPFEEYTLARDLTGRRPLEGVEDDLFAGVRSTLDGSPAGGSPVGGVAREDR
ncbi:mycothiol conjugate amidase Mca [Acidiferrimicrobium sp. IK]|uniref:mycothiol conjugate amidase Mca n=1 Tax=Acidiferrimicrobium sp. IK TaxID=2871700 RepID=UPI0021CB4A41|nr:mycothiol conjugate amidase Mca [Acidiferrimicrobium sp. IK]MCU4184154.1 mycothiol conjugate amidase Mca [Acidiferrimicrobium sp. IK]